MVLWSREQAGRDPAPSIFFNISSNPISLTNIFFLFDWPTKGGGIAIVFHIISYRSGIAIFPTKGFALETSAC